MRKIIPFNNVLTFNTDVCEITAISLEHNIEKSSDEISGVFYISGEYKITEGCLERDKFNFELPFDIALGCEYNLDSLIVDIDDFRYELVSRNSLKVNIDLYIDGEEVEKPIILEEKSMNVINNINDELVVERQDVSDKDNNELEEVDDVGNGDTRELQEDKDSEDESKKEKIKQEESEPLPVQIDLLDELLGSKEEKEMKDKDIDINNENSNDNSNSIFSSSNYPENYVTYRVYRVLENDTIDKIMEKYKLTKEELSKYNDLTNIKSGDKLIIPANDK